MEASLTALVTSDWHLSHNTRDEYRYAFQPTLRRIIKKKKVETLLFLGDITEAKDFHPSELVNRVVECFHQLATLCKVVILRGNHDATDPTVPFYSFLSKVPNITWINTPSTTKIAGIGRCLFLPHSSNYKKDWANVSFSDIDLVLAHNTFTGAEGNFGHILEGIPLDVFPKDARVISGDIHVPQKLGCVRYVGAPYLVDFGDSYEPRCLLLDGDKLTSIKLGGPQKRLVIAHGWFEGDRQIYKGIDKCSPGDILKVRVTIKREQASHWPEYKQAVREWGEKNGFIIDTVQPVITELDQINKMRSTTPKRSDEQLLSDYAKTRGVDDLTLRMGQKLL